MSEYLNKTLESSQVARLIPTISDSKKEERATSILLASFMVVPGFATSVLSDAGASIGKRSKITCYTEVVFKPADNGRAPRPDGLIEVKTGTKVWTALVEAKIGNAELKNEQIEEYLALAKLHKIDAVITISNQFATTPAHHPLTIAKSKTKSVKLYHFSWLSLQSKAALLTSQKVINDPEQAYILSELLLYLDHDSSGITALTRMPASWKDLCNAVRDQTTLSKTSEYVTGSVSGWHQLLRHLALNLSMKIGQSVDINLSRQRENDADLNFSEDCSYLVKESSLKAEFNIPNAASRLILSADVVRKDINISMKLEAPKDKSRATASISWLTRQLKNVQPEGLSIRAYWPKRIASTIKPLSVILEDPASLIPPNISEIPTHLEVVRVIELGARFKGARTFIEEIDVQFPKFYGEAGQYLSKWVAQAPKIKESPVEEPSVPTIFSNTSAGAISSVFPPQLTMPTKE
jgi:hypothetical protein